MFPLLLLNITLTATSRFGNRNANPSWNKTGSLQMRENWLPKAEEEGKMEARLPTAGVCRERPTQTGKTPTPQQNTRNRQAGSWQSFPGPSLTEEGHTWAHEQTNRWPVRWGSSLGGRERCGLLIWVWEKWSGMTRVIKRHCYHLEGGPGSFPLWTPSQ